MQSQTKKTLLGVAAGVGLAAVAGLGYYTWELNQKVEALEARNTPNINLPLSAAPDPWPKNWDPWSDNWDPSGQFAEMQKRMDEMMKHMAPGNSTFSMQGFGLSSPGPNIEVDENAKEYRVTVTVPEGEKVELNADLDGDTLKISGKVRSESESNSGGLAGKTVSASQFSQSMTLTDPVIESGMTINNKGKEIVITIPKNTG
ncbi:hypothetical protein O5O45_11250 [Hahella aquimaris]|uniref:Hsp20/alpha crystallin family protein n=1 Tax=Hahella sp. HNIBRBA332 TaxID=3015983 RepID=UPI00273B77AB|nr:hypothetical protein [Hahella sp. HNIBRBA332]WLQ16496.1 hypothetical protein O5O45_11250 [Hahella sp. HNIBRBA332]